jgi:glyoxylase-like metal-dependent hydrolase (beta-lactamase superfamily II)
MTTPLTRTSTVHEVAPGVGYLRTLIGNVVFLHDPRQPEGPWVLVDAGFPGFAPVVRAAAEKRFGHRPPAAIVITHGHFDHVGGLRSLQRAWGAPVLAHPREMPYLNGQRSYPPPDPTVGGGLFAWSAPLYPRGPIDVGPSLRELPPDGSIPGLAGWQWHHTPGHTDGHVSYFRPSDRLLIAGDALTTVRLESAFAVLTQRLELRRPPAYYTTDWPAARRSVEAIARLDPDILVSGHGRPMRGEPLHRQLDYLVTHFSEEMPRHGRYVYQPALDRQGRPAAMPPRSQRHGFRVGMWTATAAVAVGALWLTAARTSSAATTASRAPRRRR